MMNEIHWPAVMIAFGMALLAFAIMMPRRKYEPSMMSVVIDRSERNQVERMLENLKREVLHQVDAGATVEFNVQRFESKLRDPDLVGAGYLVGAIEWHVKVRQGADENAQS